MTRRARKEDTNIVADRRSRPSVISSMAAGGSGSATGRRFGLLRAHAMGPQSATTGQRLHRHLALMLGTN